MDAAYITPETTAPLQAAGQVVVQLSGVTVIQDTMCVDNCNNDSSVTMKNTRHLTVSHIC